MDVTSILLSAAVLALGIGALFPRAGVRTLAQVVLGLVFGVTALATVALVVGSAVLEKQGGAVMLLFAVIPAVAAWISGTLFFGSLRHARTRRLPIDQQMAQALSDYDATETQLAARLERLGRERRRFWITPARRRALDDAIARDTRLLGMMPALRPALEHPETYEQEPG